MAKSTASEHARQVAAVQKITANLFEQTSGVRPDFPSEFAPQRPDSRFRYLIFSFTTVHAVCAPRMRHADAVLNEVAQALIAAAVSYEGPDSLFEVPVEAQEAANVGMECVGDFLDRWSAYIEIRKGGNTTAATGLIVTTLWDIESPEPAAQGDAQRLRPLALRIEHLFGKIDAAFTELAAPARRPLISRLSAWLGR